MSSLVYKHGEFTLLLGANGSDVEGARRIRRLDEVCPRTFIAGRMGGDLSCLE